MYKIKQTKGDDYTVSEDYVLSLKVVKTNGAGQPLNILGKQYLKNDIIKITVKEYIKLSKTSKKTNLKGFKKGIDFQDKILHLDPYLLGLWLGDGNSSGAKITNQDSVILKYLNTNLFKYDCYLKYEFGRRKYNHYHYSIQSLNKGKNKVWEILKKLDLKNNKHIPLIYKINSVENRLQLLAGLLDSDGYLDPRTRTVYEITQKNKTLSDDIQFIARSLGFMCNMKECRKSCQTGTVGTYYRMHISGHINTVPCLVKRKQAEEYKHNKDILVTGIKFEELDQGECIHIENSGNKCIIFGDFTV